MSDIFAAPQHEVTAQLVAHTQHLQLPERLLKDVGGTLVKVIYRGKKSEEPVLSDTIKRFNLSLNVLHGNIEYIDDQPLGSLILEAVGDAEEVSRAIHYIRGRVAVAEVING